MGDSTPGSGLQYKHKHYRARNGVMIRRSTIVVIFFGIIVAGIVGYNLFVKNQPPLEINVVADPLAEEWIRAAAEAFNKTETLVNNGTARVHVNVMTSVNDIAVWTSKS